MVSFQCNQAAKPFNYSHKGLFPLFEGFLKVSCVGVSDLNIQMLMIVVEYALQRLCLFIVQFEVYHDLSLPPCL